MTVTTPPRRPDTELDRDLERRVADLEALIREARRRTRRRRSVYAATVVAVLAAGAWFSFGIGGNGGVSLGRSASGGPSGSLAATSGLGRWVSTGGPEGGGVLSLVVDPANPAIVYAGGLGNVFKSTDGGGRWRVASHEPWLHVSALAIDPTHPGTVYAATDRGVGKSVDGGHHWRMVNRGLFTGDVFTHWGRERSLGALLIDPNRPRTIWATGWSGLFTTTDGGGHWRFVRPRLGRYWFLSAAAIDPAHPGTLYAAWTVYYGGSALYRTTDGGNSWHRVAIQGPRPTFASLVIAPDSPGTMLATDDAKPGIYTSTDDGVTWSIARLPLSTSDGPRVIPAGDGTLYASTWSGALFTSTDVGATWQLVGTKAGPGFGLLAVDPRNPGTLYGSGDDIIKSIDGGQTWTPAHTGLVDTMIGSLALAPGSSTTLYAGTAGGIFKTTNRGRSWTLEQIASGGYVWVTTLAMSPQQPGVVYAVAQSRGLFRSGDAGGHWSRVQTPFPSKGVKAIAIDPQHPNTIYVADCGGACSTGTLQKTVDGGASWRPITGIPWAVQSLAIEPHHPNTVFAGTNRGDIYRSSDGGSSWHRVVRPPDLPRSHLYAIVAFAIDPRDPDTVYAGRRNGGIIKSSDGGDTWHRANSGLTNRRVDALAIDPNDAQILFASTEGGVFKSNNAGQSWQPYGQPAGGVTAFAIDPSGRTIYAATDGRGVISHKLGR